MKIVIDAGHGMNTAGKECLDGTKEWKLNQRIATRTVRVLKALGHNVLRVDDPSGVLDVSLANRVKAANSFEADLYISIHHNAGIGGKRGGGTEVYHYSDKQKREEQAWNLYNAITSRTHLVGNRSKKVIKNGFYVLKHTMCPAFLIENGFMDSLDDLPIIKTDIHADRTVSGIVDFVQHFNK